MGQITDPINAKWVENIYLIEETDPVKGGKDGIANRQAQQLAERTAWLKQQVIDKGQLMPWSATRTYTTGELCTVMINGVMTIMEMYSPPDRPCLNKDPSDPKNRQVGWDDATRPFWWTPYKANQVGMPFYWLAETAPEGSVMEVGANLPITVYWRLASKYPHLVNNGMINTGDIRGEFIRALDHGRGVDVNRGINTFQTSRIQSHNHTAPTSNGVFTTDALSGGYEVASIYCGNSPGVMQWSIGYDYGPAAPTANTGGSETAPRNIARAMAIYI